MLSPVKLTKVFLSSWVYTLVCIKTDGQAACGSSSWVPHKHRVTQITGMEIRLKLFFCMALVKAGLADTVQDKANKMKAVKDSQDKDLQRSGNFGGSGFNPGNQYPSNGDNSNQEQPSNGDSNGGNGDSGFHPGNSGGSGYRPGEEKPGNGESGYNPGFSGGSGFYPGEQTPHIPDYHPGKGQGGYNPGVTGGTGFHPGRPDEDIVFPGSNPGASEGSGSYPRKSGERKSQPQKKTQFRTKIVFADEEDIEKAEGSTAAAYKPGGNKGPYLKEKQTKPEAEEAKPRVYLLQPVLADTLPGRVFIPQLLVKNPSSGVSAQTLPSPIQFAQTLPKQPYVPGQNKQQYLRGGQTRPVPTSSQDSDSPSFYLLRSSGQTKPFLPEDISSLSSQILTGPVPAAVVSNTGYNPQLMVKNPSSGVAAQTLPSPIQFAQTLPKQPHVPGQNKQQYLRGGQSPVEDPSSGFLPGVSTRPSYPPGYSRTVARDIPAPRTVIYIL